ncbi:MAG: hypothetical protein WCA12_02550 [Burkholderiales bacterium]
MSQIIDPSKSSVKLPAKSSWSNDRLQFDHKPMEKVSLFLASGKATARGQPLSRL